MFLLHYFIVHLISMRSQRTHIITLFPPEHWQMQNPSLSSINSSFNVFQMRKTAPTPPYVCRCITASVVTILYWLPNVFTSIPMPLGLDDSRNNERNEVVTGMESIFSTKLRNKEQPEKEKVLAPILIKSSLSLEKKGHIWVGHEQ